MRLQRSRGRNLKYPRRELRKCHGPGPGLARPAHWLSDWQHEKSLAAGWLHRNVNSSHRKKSRCQLGSEKKFVDHEILPPGTRIFISNWTPFHAVMRRHWKAPRERLLAKRRDPELGWRAAMERRSGSTAASAMERLAWRANSTRSRNRKKWPEYSELSACLSHHWGLHPNKLRQRDGYAGRRPVIRRGTLRATWSSASGQQVDVAAAQELDKRSPLSQMR